MRSTREAPLRVALIGWGAIGRTVGRLLSGSPISDRVEIIAVGVQDREVARDELPPLAALITEPAELVGLKPDVVAEAAGRGSVQPWGEVALTTGADFIVSSVSAFADTALLESMTALADANDSRLHIQPGALAGVDALSAARLMGIDAVEHRIIKPVEAWEGTPAAADFDLASLTEETMLFEGSAAQTATNFPKNANVAMTTALAGIGPERTQVRLIADPTATTNRHEVSATGAFGRLEVVIANNPLPDNPKTSAMAALALARAIQNRESTIVI